MKKSFSLWIGGGVLGAILLASVYSLSRGVDTQASGDSQAAQAAPDPAMPAEGTAAISGPADAEAGADGSLASGGESTRVSGDRGMKDHPASSGADAVVSAKDSAVGEIPEALQGTETDQTGAMSADEEPSPELGDAGRGGASQSVVEILEGVDLSNEEERARVVAEMAEVEKTRYAAVLAKAEALGVPVRKEGPGNRVAILHDFRGSEPLYRVTMNKNAAISSAANLLYPAPYSLNGAGIKVGVWDGGSVRSTHRELTGRVTLQDSGTAVDDHATHVAGTIGATGVTANAKGMASGVRIDSYDWDDDYTEMTAGGAATAGDTNRLPISNHSYGYGATNVDMGRYEAECATTDGVAAGLPFYLICWAAGNEQDELTSLGGYQSITFNGLSKNVLTVGAVDDAVSGTNRSVAAAAMSYFSSWGPCDDGRIKPDVVANGMSMYSSISTGDSAYDTYQGTSMATPSTVGSSALLAQLYAREFSNQWMRASLLKALLIHTADDLGTAGPDYKFGWGLINVKAAADVILAHKAGLASSPKMFTNSVSTAVAGQTNTFTWDGTSPIRATLCWTDPAGAAQSASDSRTANLRNNLDLRITAPDGTTVHMPYSMPFVGVWSQASMALAATKGDNNVDNVERVDIATSNLTAGVYTVTVARDGSLYSSPQAYSLIITGSGEGADQPPILNSIGPKQVELGSNLVFTVSASDLTDGDAITLSATNLPAGAVFNAVTNSGGVTNTFTWNNASPTGTYNVTFRAVDKDGTNMEAVAITVFQPPPAAPASIWASATNTADFTAAWSAVSGATGYRLDVGTNATFSGGGAANLMANPGFETGSSTGWDKFETEYAVVSTDPQEGTYHVAITATATRDLTQNVSIMGDGSTAYEISYWYKGTGNARIWASWTAGGQVSGDSLQPGSYNPAAGGWTKMTYTVVPQSGTNTLFYEIRTYSGASMQFDNFYVGVAGGGGGAPSYVPGYSNRTVAGTSQSVTGLTGGATYYFRARAVSGGGTSSNTATASVTTTVSSVAPTFGANPGPVATTAGVAVVFTVSASGSPAPTLALQSTTASTGYVFTAGTGQLSYTPPQADGGAARTFTFTASNSAGTASQTVTVNVAAATAPAFTGGAGPYSTTAGVAVAFTVSASGMPAATLVLRSTTASTGYVFTAGTGQLSYTPPVGDVGAQTFTFTASNVAGVVTQATSVSVSAAPGTPPVVNSISAQSATVGTEFSYTVTATQTDGDPILHYGCTSAVSASTWLFDTNTGEFLFNPRTNEVGTAQFSFTAADKDGTSSPVVMSVSVTEGVPGAPAGIWASATNAADFTAAWNAASNATSYRLDVGTNATFSGAGGEATRTVLASNTAASAGAITGEWSGAVLAGTSYVIMTNSASVITSPAFSTVGFTNLTVDFRARSFGTVSGTSRTNITVSISTNNGAAWTVLAVVAPVNNTLQVQPTLTNTADLGHAQTRIRWQTLSAASGGGVGVSNLVVQGWSGASGSPVYVAGYSNRTVAGTSQSVTGLTASSTYYFRVRAVSGGGTSGNSPTGSVATLAAAPPGMAPVVDAIGAQVASVGAEFEYAVTATEPDADTVAFACTSAVDGATWDFDPDTGDFLFIPTTNQMGTNFFSFTATDKDGTSAPVAMGVKVYSAAATNDFTQWVEDEDEDPADPDFDLDADMDGDGATTWEEYLADTDPADPGEVLELSGAYFIASQVSNTTGQIRFSFPASPNRYYQLEYCTGLTNHLIGTTNLGWGVPGMVVTNSSTGTWYGVIRALLQAP